MQCALTCSDWSKSISSSPSASSGSGVKVSDGVAGRTVGRGGFGTCSMILDVLVPPPLTCAAVLDALPLSFGAGSSKASIDAGRWDSCGGSDVEPELEGSLVGRGARLGIVAYCDSEETCPFILSTMVSAVCWQAKTKTKTKVGAHLDHRVALFKLAIKALGSVDDRALSHGLAGASYLSAVSQAFACRRLLSTKWIFVRFDPQMSERDGDGRVRDDVVCLRRLDLRRRRR